uniref:Uncharacterized protein n=1 Tax=Anguilla anguilla TaxID=7936 RepID=A0A0E9X078_ANGAN
MVLESLWEEGAGFRRWGERRGREIELTSFCFVERGPVPCTTELIKVYTDINRKRSALSHRSRAGALPLEQTGKARQEKSSCV